MASPVLVVRAAVGAWTSIKYLLTRGLDIGSAPAPNPLVVSERHSSMQVQPYTSSMQAQSYTSSVRA